MTMPSGMDSSRSRKRASTSLASRMTFIRVTSFLANSRQSRVPSGGANGLAGGGDVDQRTILAAVREFTADESLLQDSAQHVAAFVGCFAGRDQRIQYLAEGFLAGIAEHGLRALAPMDHPAPSVGRDQRVGGFGKQTQSDIGIHEIGHGSRNRHVARIGNLTWFSGWSYQFRKNQSS